MKMKTLTQIASEYGIHYKTLRKKLQDIPYFKLKFLANDAAVPKKKTKLLTIQEIEVVYRTLGDPGAST